MHGGKTVGTVNAANTALHREGDRPLVPGADTALSTAMDGLALGSCTTFALQKSLSSTTGCLRAAIARAKVAP